MNGKAEKKKENRSSILSSSSPQDLVLLGAAQISNKRSSSGTGPSQMQHMQEADAIKTAKNTRCRSSSAYRKATYRFLRVGRLPRKNVQQQAAISLPAVPQSKDSK